jgi:hypothetical protein
MQRPHAAAAGGSQTFGPDADAEGLVLDLLNRQDRYVARRSCQAAQHGLGARTTTLVLCEDRVDGAEVLPPVDLASSFPGVRTLALRCDKHTREGWPARFCAFVARNLAALQHLQHLDLLGAASPPALGSVAQLTALRSLALWIDHHMEAASWSTLRSLAQLTSLRVVAEDKTEDGHLQHIAAAAPWLQQLHYDAKSSRQGHWGVSCLSSLRSLASLQLTGAPGGSARLARALTALPGLTHLGVKLNQDMDPLARSQLPPLMQLMQALGQLTGLSSLELGLSSFQDDPFDSVPLAVLEALQQLTRLSLGSGALQPQDSAVLARLGALRSLSAEFEDQAAAAAAGLQRLQGVTALVKALEAEEPMAPVQLAEGCCLRLRGKRGLRCFDTSQVHVLELHDFAYVRAGFNAAAVSQALRRGPQLRGLQLHIRQALKPRVLQAATACSQLTSLHLAAAGDSSAAGWMMKRLGALQGLDMPSYEDYYEEARLEM